MQTKISRIMCLGGGLFATIFRALLSMIGLLMVDVPDMDNRTDYSKEFN
jgi:hypothetical protein